MKTIAIYGKGGGGKSTVSSNISARLSMMGLKVLQVGCDPKHDSTLSLTEGRMIPTVISLMQKAGDQRLTPADFVFPGLGGISCMEAGGPEPGLGCAGRGIVHVFDLIRDNHLDKNYDVAVFDILGDVVCGGFASPLMHGFASKVGIVVSDSKMSLYAGNNIIKAVRRFRRNGAMLAGIIGNNIVTEEGEERIRDFAARVGANVLAMIPHDLELARSTAYCKPLYLHNPDLDLNRVFEGLARRLYTMSDEECTTPTPMDDDQVESYLFKSGML